MAVDKKKLFEELLKKKGIHTPQGPLLKRYDQTGPFKLSFAQRRICFLQQFDPQSAAYNDPTALRLKGTLDFNALEQTFNEIIRRHHILQMVFPEEKGQPVLNYHPQHQEGQPVKIAITRVHLDDISGNEPQPTSLEERLRQFINSFCAQPFDLKRDLLVRVSLLTISDHDYVLVVNMHHIILDGWSKGIMLQELMDLYQAFSSGNQSPLPELPLQYHDYVTWLHEWMQGKIFENQLAYWEKELKGAAPVLELPIDHPRPSMASGKGSWEPFRFAPATLQALNTLAREENVTLFMLLLSIYMTLLFRYSSQEDILVGTPVAGRQRVELENLIGLFVNTVVIRSRLTGDTPFNELLARVRQTALQAFSHQDMPFEKLVEELNPQRSLSVLPIFQVMFQLQNAPMPPARISGLTITPIQVDTGFSQVDLSLTVWEEEQGLNGSMEYNSDLFERSTIQRMVCHFQALVESVLVDHRRTLSSLPMLTDKEQYQVIVEWNQTAALYPREQSIHELFSRCAGLYPHHDAVVFGHQRLGYKELDEASNRLARVLFQVGVRPETLVAICLENSLELITGVMAILKAGGAYIPMDPAYPDKRLNSMVKDSSPAVLVTRSAFKPRFPRYPGVIICVDQPRETIFPSAGEEEWENRPKNQPGHAACVIYTSGSSGEPKGIVIEHGNIVNLVTSFIESYHPGPGDRVLPLTSIASASFVGEILPILTAGGAIVLADKVHFLDMKILMELLEQLKITILSTVPSMIARLNASAWKPAGLRLLLSGGEALSAGDIDHIKKTVTVVNGYGLTETTICSTYTIVNRQEEFTGPGIVITVGKPIINTQLYILDQWKNPVPVGVPGEIYIGGAGVSRGYLNNPGLTQERFTRERQFKFIQPSFQQDSASQTGRLYRTGDLGSWLADGNIKFLGRIDTQVQIHGFRIELAEIEKHLGLHPDIQDVFVIDREFSPGDRRLVGYMVIEKGRTLGTSQLREWLASRVPEYMIPAVFQEIDTMPLTMNGKVDIAALPIPSGERPGLEVDFKAPQSEAEKKIAAVWQEYLKLDRVGINDNFFDLGGHSLLLTQVHSRLSEIFTTGLTIVDLFRYPTIYLLAKSLTREDNSANQETLKKLQERASKQRQAINRGFFNKSGRRSSSHHGL